MIDTPTGGTVQRCPYCDSDHELPWCLEYWTEQGTDADTPADAPSSGAQLGRD